MQLIHDGLDPFPSPKRVLPSDGALSKTAADLSSQIDAFLELSRRLDLTLHEEETLLSMESDQWAVWRSRSVPAITPAPPLLVRRLDYALSLLPRMIAAAAAEASRATPGKPLQP